MFRIKLSINESFGTYDATEEHNLENKCLPDNKKIQLKKAVNSSIQKVQEIYPKVSTLRSRLSHPGFSWELDRKKSISTYQLNIIDLYIDNLYNIYKSLQKVEELVKKYFKEKRKQKKLDKDFISISKIDPTFKEEAVQSSLILFKYNLSEMNTESTQPIEISYLTVAKFSILKAELEVLEKQINQFLTQNNLQ